MKKFITLLTTTRCNLSCRHCLRDPYRQQPDADLPLEVLSKILRQGRVLGYNHVAVTGGEAGLHPHFVDMIALVCSAGFRWSLVTNGWEMGKFEPAFRLHKEQCSHITVSLDGLEEIHDAIRGRGSFTRVMAALDFLHGIGVPFTIAVCLNALNYGQLADIIELAIKAGAETFAGMSVIPTPSNQALQLNDNQKQAAQVFLDNAKGVLPLRIERVTSLYSVEDPEEFCSILDFPVPTFNARGEYTFCCDNNGDGFAIGDINEESFSDLYIKQIELGARLKEIRRRMIAEGRQFEGFNSCHFCNTVLANGGL